MPFKDKNRYKTPEYKALQAEWSRNWYKRNKDELKTLLGSSVITFLRKVVDYGASWAE